MGKFDEYLAEIEKVRLAIDMRVVGQDDLKDSLINCLLAGGLSREENSHTPPHGAARPSSAARLRLNAGKFQVTTRTVEAVCAPERLHSSRSVRRTR